MKKRRMDSQFKNKASTASSYVNQQENASEKKVEMCT